MAINSVLYVFKFHIKFDGHLFKLRESEIMKKGINKSDQTKNYQKSTILLFKVLINFANHQLTITKHH